MAYGVIDLGRGRLLQDTTSDIEPLVDAALERAQKYPIHLARQLRAYYGVFPKLLEKLINLHGTDGPRALIAENLYEENGSGDPTRNHRVLYDNFLDTLVASGVRNRPPAAPAGNNESSMAPVAARALLSIVGRQPYPTAVTAVFALEHRGPAQMAQLRDFYAGLGTAALDLEFFDVHIVGDQEHGRQFQELVAAEVDSGDDLAAAQRGLGMVVATDALLWQSI